MRTARDVATLDPVDLGDHVCWQVGPADDFRSTARAFTADAALFGDKLLILGSLPRRSAQESHQVLLSTVRGEAAKASREGFRALRVLARMDQVLPEDAGPDAVARHELGLDAVVAGSGAILVCAYPHGRFSAACLRQATGVHPLHLGSIPAAAAFRLFSAASPGHWSIQGVVDADGADSFFTGLCELLVTESTLHLHCDGLELIDVAGMASLVKAARALPDRRITLHGANEALRRHWRLLGFEGDGVPVELAP